MSETEQFLPLFFVEVTYKVTQQTWEIVEFNMWINKTYGLPNQIQNQEPSVQFTEVYVLKR